MTRKRKKTWMDDAACKTENGKLASVFYSNRKEKIARAKAICAGCPSRAPCYDYAIRNKEPGGIWGGVQFDFAGPIHDPVIVPEASTYTYTPTRLHQQVSFKGTTSELSRQLQVDSGAEAQGDSHGQTIVRISEQGYAE